MPENNEKKPNNAKQSLNKTVKFELALLIILLAAIVLMGGVFLWDSLKEDNSNNVALTQQQFEDIKERLEENREEDKDEPTGEPVSGWEAYTNSSLGISFQYPPSWTIQRVEDTGNNVVEIVAKRDENTSFTYHSGTYTDVGFAEESTVVVDGRELTQKRREFDIHIPVSDTQLIKFESDKLDTYDDVFTKILSTVNFLE